MELSIQLPKDFNEQTVRELLEQEWLVPRKVRHFLRTRKNVSINGEPALFHLPVKSGDVVRYSSSQKIIQYLRFFWETSLK